jgi:ATP/maltotriose-dependent transcriptional regulator MalT
MLATPALDDALRRFANALAADDSPALVLDDFHRITSPAAQQVVAGLVENSPVSFQLLIAARADPRLRD